MSNNSLMAARLRQSIEALGPEGIGINVSMSYEFACDLLDALSTPPIVGQEAREALAPFGTPPLYVFANIETITNWLDDEATTEAVASRILAALTAEPAAKEGDDKLPCDIKLPPATLIRAGCSFETLRVALSNTDRPKHFPETAAERQARAVMMPQSGSVTAPSGGQSYGMLSGCMDFAEPSPPSPHPDMGSGIKTWEQRCEEHPDHEEFCVTPGMIQARMPEEIDDLRAALSPPASQSVEKIREALSDILTKHDRTERYQHLGEGNRHYTCDAVEVLITDIKAALSTLPHKEEATPATITAKDQA